MMLKKLLVIVCVCLTACVPSPSTETDADPTAETPEIVNAGDGVCVYPLVMLQTGPDATCSGGNIHAWPVGMASDDCHGWTAYDTSGRLHENSANNIVCNADDTFSFTQYAGTLTCEGGTGGTTKTYALNSCEQDIPPTLYTQAIDLTCCLQPDSPECQSGIPSVTAGAGDSEVYLNGQICPEE